MEQENITDDDVSIYALSTVMEEQRAELENLKGQLENDKTESWAFRGMMIRMVFAAVLHEHFPNEYYS